MVPFLRHILTGFRSGVAAQLNSLPKGRPHCDHLSAVGTEIESPRYVGQRRCAVSMTGPGRPSGNWIVFSLVSFSKPKLPAPLGSSRQRPRFRLGLGTGNVVVVTNGTTAAAPATH